MVLVWRTISSFGGTLVTATDTVSATLAVSDGKVSGILASDADVSAVRDVDATGKYILPGGINPHVHMMDPRNTDREDFPTGTAAAAVDGITTVGEHHRTDPTVLSAAVLRDKREYLSGCASSSAFSQGVTPTTSTK